MCQVHIRGSSSSVCRGLGEAWGSRFKSWKGGVVVVRGGAGTPSEHHRGTLEQGTNSHRDLQ